MSFLLSHPCMLLLGLLTHYLMILTEISASRKRTVTPWEYVKEKPYKAALSAIGSIVAYSMLPVDAKPFIVFGAGYMANDALDRIGSITNKAMTRTIVVNEQGQVQKIREMDQTIIDYGNSGENEALDRPSEVPRD